MSQGRHQGRHRLPAKPPVARGNRRTALLAAPLATIAVVGAGVGVSELPSAPLNPTAAGADLSAAATHRVSSSAIDGAARSVGISRDLDRLAERPVGHKWSTADLNVYTKPSDGAPVVDEVPAAKKVTVTAQTLHGFTGVMVGDALRWVHSAYLAAKKPADPASLGLTFQPCAATASVEHGLVPGAIRAWEAVCNDFPQVTTYGGLANRPEHDTGHAVDAMVYGDSALGYKIAEFLQAHAAELDIYDIIYRQHIWTPVRASEGWRLMPDRGSPTANHMDHVHFAVN
ncbi:SH3 domain-containing protein [Nocardioides terrisoli]|uniref:SH3 domain-containing protein n=1 Tax=Nocardioides terrisoli TaxID=3388267 RepID=UPI00287BC855|nr:SH3 domain-containing protein [Nocardioides marmorisolisilvae]